MKEDVAGEPACDDGTKGVCRKYSHVRCQNKGEFIKMMLDCAL